MAAFADFGQDNGFSSLDAKLEGLALDDDIAIYDFGGEGYDTLGDALQESGNELNEDTFGGDEPVGRDFDFGAQSSLPPLQPPAKKDVSWNLDDDLLLAPKRSSALPVPPPPPVQEQKPRMRTLEEIEAELLASNRSPTPLAAPAPAVQARPRTLEEIEAEMFSKPAQQEPAQPKVPPIPQQQLPAVFQNRPMPPVPPQFQNMPFNRMAALNAPSVQFPPLGIQGPVVPPPPRAPTQPEQLTIGQLHAAKMQILARYPNGQIPADQIPALQQIDHAIAENERREQLIRRRANKLMEMSSHNGIMSNSEKDFITRIQLSQLLNTLGPGGQHDPLKDDFYFTVFTAIRGARLQAKQGGKTKHMNRLANQVQRIVDDAKKKPRASNISLDGALGKISLRSKSAPRQLLQMSSKSPTPSSPHDAISSPASAIPKKTQTPAEPSTTQPAMTKREALLHIERIYNIVLEMEQIKRMQPQINLLATTPGDLQEENQAALKNAQEKFEALTKEMWEGLHVTKPLETSVPHPFISLMTPNKGKRMVPRILRHLDQQQTLTLFTLLLATFGQLDVVCEASLLDMPPDTLVVALKKTDRTRADLEASNQAFMQAIVPTFLTTLGKLPLKVVTGMLALFLQRNDVVALAKSKAGIAFLTLFLSRAELLKQGQAVDVPTPDEAEKSQWTATFNSLFASLQGHFVSLFPSTRYVANLPFGASRYLQSADTPALDLDAEDEAIWSFYAALAVSSDMGQQQQLVSEVREKVLECVTGAASKTTPPDQAARKIRNVNLMLNALGLDASQISTA